MYGWTKLYSPVVRFIKDNGGKIVQLKEKFGECRIYWNAGEDWSQDMYDVVDLAVQRVEYMSGSFCIECGKSAHLYTKGWILPLCDEHAEMAGYEKGTGKRPRVITRRYEMPPEQNP